MRILSAVVVAVALFAGSASSGFASTIAGVASSNPHFSTLVTALKAAGLVGVLSDKGHYTVFAPTNEAFAELPAGTVASLLKPRNRGKLKAILLYHVLGKTVTAGAIPRGVTHVGTLNGQTVRVRKNRSGVSVNDAHVTTADIMASNGVIHVIDKVLLPK